MCFYFQLTEDAKTLQNRYNATLEALGLLQFGTYNGFTHPETPVITNEKPDKIQMYQWGLIPYWAKDTGVMKSTLNAKIETIQEKPSFKYSINNRCLILANGFYEWQWLDEKGKNKQKYLITLPDNRLFAFAGLFSHWKDIRTGEVRKTYTILTTQANELMSKIHNSKQRMPVILKSRYEKDWLNEKESLLMNEELVAVKI